jgi:PAS domain S-box-containing protein
MATILIVDDHLTDREVLVTLLGDKGHHLLEASDGAEGLAVAKAEQPDLIIADILMPTMDGYEFVRQLRAEPALAQIPIIFYTTHYREAEARALAQSCGVPYVLTKPSEPEAILRAIEAALGPALPLISPPQPEMSSPEDLRLLATQLSEKIDELQQVSEQLEQQMAERQQAEAEIQRRNRELILYNKIIAASAAGLAPEAMLETACRELTTAFGAAHVTAALLDERKREAVVAAEHLTSGHQPALGHVIAIEASPPFQYLLTHQGPLAISDAQNDPRLAPFHSALRQEGVTSLLMLPLIIRGEVVGSLALGTTEPRHFSSEEISLAWSVADQVAGALDHARLTQTQRHLATAIEQAGESIVITDTQGTIQYVNPAFERITGYSQAEAVGQNPRFLKSGKHTTAFYQTLWATITAGQVWQGRLVNRKKDGTLYTEEATISPVRNESGEIASYVAVKRDVTRELRLEEQYYQAQKMEAIGRLTAGVAHDFNNILTTINGFSELMSLELAPDDPLQDSVKKVLGSGQRAAGLVRQLLAFSRKQIVQPAALNLNEAITSLDKMLRRIIGEDVELETIPAPGLWLTKADPVQVEQIILNLAVNARDAMPQGGKLTIETANVTLDEAYATGHLEVQPGEYVLLAVSDTGLGMSEEVKAHLFEPFFTTKEPGRGTGLGLATVYGIVKQSGGDIWVYSELGRGTTFKIYLPRMHETAHAVEPHPAPRDILSGTETVLVVEDEEGVRALARRVLEMRGYTVLEAGHGGEALLLGERRQEPIHLLLTDVVMPRMSGHELANRLAALHPEIKVLYLSGYTDQVIVRHGVLEPGVFLLQKPFSPQALAHKVREVLDAPHWH